MGCRIGGQCYIESNKIDTDNYSVPVILSDESDVKRYSWEDGEYVLTLEHTSDAVDLERAGILSIFVNHDTTQLPIGVYQDIRVEDGKLKANAIFDPDDTDSMKIFNKLSKGFLKSFSIGADILEKVLVKEIDGVKYYKATKWSIYECSVVGIPAIPTAKVGLEKEMVAIPTAKSDKIVNSKKGESMELSKENFDKLMLEKSNLEAELTKATADMDSAKAELEKVVSEKETLSKSIELTKSAMADKSQIVGLAFEFGMDKEATLELMKSETLEQANAKTLELLRSGKATVLGDGSEEHFSKVKPDDISSVWDKIK